MFREIDPRTILPERQNKDVYQLPPNVNLLTFEPWLNASQEYPNKQFLVTISLI
jgi:hypothetical protein